MAHHDASIHSESLRAVADQVHFVEAEFTRLMQVNIDLCALAVGDVEDLVEMAFRVAIDRAGIDTTDDARALVDRGFHQFGTAGIDQHAGLRECNQFEADRILHLLPRGQHAMDIVELVEGRDIDMAADVGGAHGHALPHQAAGAILDRPGQVAADLDLVVDHRTQACRHVDRMPWQAPEDLVQVHMCLDKGRHGDGAAPVVGGRARWRSQAGSDCRDLAIEDEHIGRRAVFGPYVCDQKV